MEQRIATPWALALRTATATAVLGASFASLVERSGVVDGRLLLAAACAVALGVGSRLPALR